MDLIQECPMHPWITAIANPWCLSLTHPTGNYALFSSTNHRAVWVMWTSALYSPSSNQRYHVEHYPKGEGPLSTWVVSVCRPHVNSRVFFSFDPGINSIFVFDPMKLWEHCSYRLVITSSCICDTCEPFSKKNIAADVGMKTPEGTRPIKEYGTKGRCWIPSESRQLALSVKILAHCYRLFVTWLHLMNMNNVLMDESALFFLFFFFSLFQNGVVHRDLKLENVLLDENLNIKVLLYLVSFHSRGE